MIEPFIEGKENVRTIAVSGGIDISSFGNVLQGVDLRNKYRYKGILPIIGTGDESNITKVFTIGTAIDYSDSVPFDDRSQPTTTEYLNNPDTIFNYSFQEGFSVNGVIEPLCIRDEASFSSIQFPISNKIHGDIGSINTDLFNYSDTIESRKQIKVSSLNFPFEDSSDYFGSNVSSSIVLPGLINPSRRKLFPFDDTKTRTRNLTNNSLINRALLAMTGVIDNEDLITINKKSSTCGYYWITDNGTDSLSYGGLKR